MNTFTLSPDQVNSPKQLYPMGTRIKLIKMTDRYHPVPPGTSGTVMAVDDIGTIHVHWDNGQTLGVIVNEDEFRVMTTKEIREENT